MDTRVKTFCTGYVMKNNNLQWQITENGWKDYVSKSNRYGNTTHRKHHLQRLGAKQNIS